MMKKTFSQQARGASNSCQRMATTTPLKTGFRGVINALFKKEDMWKKVTKPCLSRLMYKEVIRKLYFLVKHPSYMGISSFYSLSFL